MLVRACDEVRLVERLDAVLVLAVGFLRLATELERVALDCTVLLIREVVGRYVFRATELVAQTPFCQPPP